MNADITKEHNNEINKKEGDAEKKRHAEGDN